MRTALLLSLLAAATAHAESPISLTASDGTGLSLVSLTARGVVEEPLAFTELSLVFENPSDRTIEGQFRIVLPPGAAVSRFAMKLDGRWQEGEVVEKQAARRAYEDFLHRRQDPALLEQAAGNEFSARVFPIPARGKKELILSYSHALTGNSPSWALPLKGLSQVGTLDVKVFSRGAVVQALAKEKFVPNADFVAPAARSERTGLRSGEQVLLRVAPLSASSREPLDSVAVLVDTSASRALGFDAQLELLEGLVAAMDPKAALAVAAFDQRVQPVFSGEAARFGAAQLKALRDRRALGASDLQGALAWAKGAGKRRVLLLTDGVATAGEVEGDLLMAAVKGLKGVGVTRLDAIAVGGLRDEAALRQLVTAGLPRDGALLDGALAPAVLLDKLTLQTRSKLEVAVAGASFVWPTRLDGVQPGDEVLIAAQVPVGKKVELRVGGQAFEVDSKLAQVDGTLLTRAVVQARLAALQEQIDRVADGPKEKQALREQLVALSVKHRVLCPLTALLVLETEADYARFHIDRRALADILTVEQGALVARKRGAETVASAPVLKVPSSGADKVAASKPMTAKQSAREESSFDGAPKGGKDKEEEKQESVVVDGAPPSAGAAAPPPAPEMEPARPAPRPVAAPSMRDRSEERPEPSSSGGSAAPQLKMTNPYEGPFKQVMDKLAAKDLEGALAKARGWREEQPGDVLALVALGEALEAKGDLPQAARAYGSLIDLFPARADLRRFAGTRLERLRSAEALALAVDTFAKAAEQRADHPASHRLLAFALLRSGAPGKAFAAMEKGLAQQYPSGRFRGVEQILREDLGLIAAAWIKAEPSQRAQVLERLKKAGGVEETAPSLRFILNWETDANDVDFHIIDGKGGHAFYSQKTLASGGSLYADVTTGYGPECFTIRLPRGARAYPYALSAQYYSRGPMGYGMGKLEILEHDGQGGLGFTERPYVVMVDQAFVDMGTVTAATVK